MKRYRSLISSVITLVLLSFFSSSSSGVVGVTDPCPLPTPYPPASAGAGVVNNGSLESTFTNGVANQWIGWKDATFTGQVHLQGTDRFYDGSSSQKLDLPQPPPNTDTQEAGVYQQVWVVPGQSYTATVKVWLDFPGQSYNGEDLTAKLGLDPFGQDSGDGYGMIWSADVASQSQWITATVTAQAYFPVMTIGLKGTRKWPQHGNGAKVWFDVVTFSGPIPTGTRPGPEPDPTDPETLIPATVGSNLVTNASFEGTYTNGISANWNSWSTTGTGTWRRSQRVGKVGGGKYDCGDANQLAYMNPKTILLLGGTPSATNPNDAGGNGTYGDSTYLPATYSYLENTIFVGRPYIDPNWDTYKTNPTFYGAQLADQMHQKQLLYPRIDAWQGYNEPDWGGTWQTTISFEKAFAERLHYWGMKICAINLSTGSPGNMWRMIDETYNPSCHALLDIADYLGHHTYGGPDTDLMVTNQVSGNACDFALRPRRFKDMYDRRGWRFPPIIATEGSTWGPWHNVWSSAQVSTDLTTMGSYMNANRWWCGYTNFVVGAQCSGWVGWEIIGQGTIVTDVGTWNSNNPSDSMDGLYSQMIGSGYVHPNTTTELTPAGNFNGGLNQQVTGLTSGQAYLAKAWVKYEFRGAQPAQLNFYLGVDTTGQTSNPNAASIDWGVEQIAARSMINEIFTHAWRTFTATGSSASVWLRTNQTVADPSFMFYCDLVEVKQLSSGSPFITRSPSTLAPSCTQGNNAANQTFTVANGGGGTLNYSITDNATWLSVSPTSGTSTGEADAITVTYSTSSLAAGTYNGTITITDAAASNNPQTIAVTLTVNALTTIAEDFNSMPTWASSFDAGWGSAATWSIVTGGQSGNCLQASRSSAGSSVKAALYTILANTNYSVSIYIRCPSSSAYWAETAYKLGNFNAQDFDTSPASWTMIKKFSDTGTNGNADTWTQYSLNFNTGSSTQISIAYKLGCSSGTGPVLKWDTLRIIPQTGPPTITRSPATLAPSAMQGNDAQAQTFTVQNTGGNTLNYTITDDASWLSVTPGSGTGTGEIDAMTVNYSTLSLAVGTYNATITISDSAATNNPQTIAVTLTVTALPAITRSPATLAPSTYTGASPAAQSFTVQNSGGNTLNYSISVNQTWLSVTPTSGTSTGEVDTITVNYSTASLAAGTYNATITISDPVASNTPQTIAVTLTVSARPTIARSPATLSPSTYTGASPSAQSFTVQNTGANTLSYSITDDATWLSQTPTSGTSTGEVDTITVNYSTVSLAAGTYNATITITDANASNNPQTIAVTLTVLARPTITRSPTALSPSCLVGTNAAAQTFTVQNTGSNTLSYSITDDASWLSETPTSGTSTGEVDTMNVTYATSGLVRGTYSSTITITDANATNNPQTIPVALTVYIAGEDYEFMPAWSSSFDAGWGGAASWSIVTGGQTGNALQAVRSNTGSSAKAMVYSISASSSYTISVWIKCPSSSSAYWAENAFKLGNFTAQDFDNNSATWTLIKKFSDTGTNGNGNVWTQYTASFSSGANTQISVGFKLGSSSGNGPVVQWDTLRIQ